LPLVPLAPIKGLKIGIDELHFINFSSVFYLIRMVCLVILSTYKSY